MIKPIRAWVDSQGDMHATPEAAAKAEFRRLVVERFPFHESVVDTLVENMFELDKMFGEATKEDSRADIGLKSDG